MTRPRTGQRKLGRSPAGSAVLTELSSAGRRARVGEASRALCGDSIVATPTCVAAAAGGVGTRRHPARGAAGTGRGASRMSGMMMRSPTLTMVSGGILLALASTMTGLP